MFRYFLKPLFAFHKPKHCTPTIFRFIETQSASNRTNLTDEHSLTVSYLTNSCGLSVKSAISASRLVNIKNRERSDSVLELLRSHGFSPKEISTLISRCPRFLSACPVNNLKPKFEFLESLGVAGSSLPTTLFSCNRMLSMSLNKTIKPKFDFLKHFVDTNEKPMRILKVLIILCSHNLEKTLVPNVETLRNHNVPDSQIGRLLLCHTQSLTSSPDMFKEVVTAVMEMGFDQKRKNFISALASLTIMSKATWDGKKKVLLSFGWTDSDFDRAFKLQPLMMLTSKKKMREIMDFLVNKVGVKASDVAGYPNLMLASLERRLIPRWSYLQALKSKGLISQNLVVLSPFVRSKQEFETRYVTKYKDEFSEIIDAYKHGIGLN